MVLAVRLDILAVNVPVPNVPDSVVVAITVERSAAVPYANPRIVDEAYPLLEMFPFNVTVEVETGDAAEVVIEGCEQEELVSVELRSCPEYVCQSGRV